MTSGGRCPHLLGETGGTLYALVLLQGPRDLALHLHRQGGPSAALLARPSVFISSSCVLFTDSHPEAAGAVHALHGPRERRGGGTELICH